MMKKYKYLSVLFGALAILLSDVMCAVAAYNYCALEWGARYEGWSAPANTALVLVIPPYGAGIAACAALCWLFGKKYLKAR